MPHDDEAKAAPAPQAVTAGSFQRRAVTVTIVLLVAAGLFTLKDFLPALVWALVFAIALWPLRDRLLARFPRRGARWVPGGLLLSVLLAFVIPVVVVSVPLAEVLSV